MKSSAVQVEFFNCINTELFCFAKWFGLSDTESDDQEIWLLSVNLLKQFAAFICPQIHYQYDWASLLKHRLKPIWVLDLTHFRNHSQECSRPANEVGVLGI
ncbi:MAG TPA: hypothetical protein VNX27_06475 [Chthoniobacterales bacterium]|nr:hypothetical protein [Chthoniobacterales bacterium]